MECKKRLFMWNNRFIRNLFLMLLLFSTNVAFAQVNVRGKVIDSTGETLIGVNVVVKDTHQGTITDANISLDAPKLIKQKMKK